MSAVEFVDPRIGTAGSGKAIVGPQMPHGMVKLAPNTQSLPNAGYDARDSRINTFAHTHLEGVGGRGGRGLFGFMPTRGELKTSEYEYSSAYRHQSEQVRVGYYAVTLEDSGIRVELAASEHCAVHRYTFPADQSSRVMVDAGHTTGLYNRAVEAHLEQVGPDAISGWGLYPPSAISGISAPAYFYALFSRPFDSVQFFDALSEEEETVPDPALRLGLNPYRKQERRRRLVPVAGTRADTSRALCALGFQTGQEERIEVRVGISFISVEQARQNLYAEVASLSFEDAEARCREAWEQVLSRIEVQDADERKKRIFYSALYRAMNQPTEYTEQGLFCIASDGRDKIKKNGQGFYSDMWALWDTFRTANPLQVLLEPERASDICQSLVEYYKDCGVIPTCPAPARGVNAAMVGHNYTSVLADAYVKGCRDFEVGLAYEAMRRSAMEGVPAAYAQLGYVPANTAVEEDFCVTETVEYVYADWCCARLALALGKREDHDFFTSRAQNYRKLFDERVGLLRRRDDAGAFVEDFDEMACFKHGYCESSPFEATFFVPHDPQGLINLFGSRQAFINALDRVFELDRHNFENETSLHLPFMYIYAGKPSRTADIVRDILVPTFTDEVDGLYGEDDAGALSAFHAFAHMGIYPACPGRAEYVLFSPWLDGWSMQNPDGSRFCVRTVGNCAENRYVQRATLNGETYTKSYITHEQLRAGGELVLYMGSEPSDYGTRPCDLPASDSALLPEKYTPSGRVLWGDARSDRMVRAPHDPEPFTVSARVYNDSREPAICEAVLCLDGCEVERRRVSLAPQERRRVSFSLRLAQDGPHEVRVGGCEPILLEVCGAPGEDYVCFSNTEAEFFAGRRHLYVYAAGDQGPEHYGMIFKRERVYGDFDAVVRIDHKDHTSPYAPCGIVVRNEVDDPITCGYLGGMYMGAMCTRGFYAYLGGGPNCEQTGTHWAMGAPRFPCYLKIEKRGKRFRGLYSLDGQSWTLKAEGCIPQAAEGQFVGVYSRSCIHDKGLARFDGGLQITPVKK